MNAVLEQTILDRLRKLDEEKLQEVLDFVDFLCHRRDVLPLEPEPRKEAVLAIMGKYRGRLGTTDEFMAHKEEEKQLEEEKWRRK